MAAKDDAKTAVENTAKAIQEHMDEVHAKGYDGVTVDETPRENYTVQGVIAGKPTPENGK